MKWPVYHTRGEDIRVLSRFGRKCMGTEMMTSRGFGSLYYDSPRSFVFRLGSLLLV